ncbi:MAG: 50S ribosomal protein L31 [Christensenellales bacterium]|jgi:large subunit ribosomal protein L31|nr:50S ribosomal protein L31 [Clostridiales bacterium]
MKEGIHPDYKVVDAECACGAKFRVGTTKKVDSMRVDICNECHPFYTGKQKIVDTGGRVDKFRKRYGLKED